MNLTRLRIAAAALLFLAALTAGAAYFKYKAVSNYIISQVSGEAARKLGRQVKFGSVSFSPLTGVVITDACISRRPDFSKGNFFCAEKTVLRPQFSALMKNQIYFSKVSFEKPVLKVREKNGTWDFEDLLALLPKTDKGLYLTWNASELTMRGAALEADLDTSGLSLSLENADIDLEHYSSFGGNYSISAGGLVKTVLGGKLLSADVKLASEADFDYGGLASTKGSLGAKDVSFGAITLEALKADWNLFNLRKPLADKNYAAAITAEKLFIPGQENSIKNGVSKSLALFSAAMGRPTPEIEDIEMSSLSASFRLDNSALAFKDVALRTNFMDLSAGLAIDGPAGTASASIDAAIGANKIAMSASGPLASPEIEPVLSSTLAARLKEALRDVENALLKLFPVTGEHHV